MPRLVVAGLVIGLLLAADRVDPVAAGMAVAALGATAFLLRHRSRRGERHAVLVLGGGATIAALLVAVSLPVYRSRPAPLLVNVGTTTTTGRPAAPPAAPAGAQAGTTGGTEVLGFAASDYDETTAAVDRDVAGLSTLAVTGATLGSHPGSVEVRPVSDGLVRAHLAGAEGLLVISNYDGHDWNGGRVRALLNDKEARRRFVSAVSSAMARSPWDGVVLDFENLDPEVRDGYPTLVAHLAEALRRRRVLVAVPAFTDPGSEDAAPFDLSRLAANGVGIVWMAYDQHDPTGEAGPIGGLPWVRQTLATALRTVPPSQLLLGVAAYGYAWPAKGQSGEVEDLTVPEATALAARSPGRVTWDEEQGEWGGTLTDGRTVWYDDARSMAQRAKLATDAQVGVALWRVGSEAPGAFDSLGLVPAKHAPQHPDRPVRGVSGPVVALTFDDGPDAKWTPRILEVLRREHVPATFFVIGKEAELHPGLLRQELNEGHVIGDHTYSHPDLAKTANWRARMEIFGGAWVVEGQTGRRPRLFRSPYGNGDAGPRIRGADQLSADLGFNPVGWTDDTNDWEPGAGPGNIVKNALSQLSERTIILMHDGGGPRGATVAALPHLIEALKARGYLFVTADGLDGATPDAYAVRRGPIAAVRGLLVVAAFRLQLALRRLLLWIAVATAVGSLIRLVLATPLALVHRFRQRRHRRGPAPWVGAAGERPPDFTVIIPAFNEERVIAKAIAAVARLDPAPAELIVVDDGSTDATAEVAAAAARVYFTAAGRTGGARFRLVRQDNQGKAGALNHGLLLATTELALVLDADTVVSPGLLGAFRPHFADPKVGAVAGNVKVGNRRNLLAALQALEYVVALNLDRRAQDVARAMAVVPGAAGAFRVAAVRQVGGYQSDTVVEDADLTAALQRAGWRIPYEPAAVAWTEAPERLSDVVRQRRRWSYGTVQVVAKHRRALLEPEAGNIGLVGLPWNLLSSVILPALGPFADVWLVYLVLSGELGLAAGVLALAIAADLVVAALAVAADGERWSLVALAPLLRLLWRPLQLAVVIRSLRRWAVGADQHWDKVGRYDTVFVPIEEAAEAAALVDQEV